MNCTHCKKRPRVDGFKRCQKCINYFRNYRKERNKTHCSTCGGSLDTNKKTCSKCLEQKKDYHEDRGRDLRSARIEKRKNENSCIICGLNSQTQQTFYCNICLDKQKEDRKERRKLWISEGLCSNCGNEKIVENQRCKRCSKFARRTVLRRKKLTFEAYGNSCYCCGIDQFEFLCLDHVMGDGYEHRKNISQLYDWAKQNNYPDRLRIACLNCNFGRSRNLVNDHGGVCPHKISSLKWNEISITPLTKFKLQKAPSNTKSELKLKLTILEGYGSKCACCEINQFEFLTIDHIEGGGRKHVDSIVGNIYSWAKKNNLPKNLQVLCMKCNLGREVNGGVCPHKSKIKSYRGISLTTKSYNELLWNTSRI